MTGSPVDGAGAVGVPFVRDIAHGHGEGEDAVFVINQDFTVIARFDAAEGDGGPGGEADGEDRSADIRPERDEPGAPADLDAGFDQLLGEPFALVLAGHKDVEVLFL
jgi:hypothetical protein